MTKPIASMNKDELINFIEGYASNACKCYYEGKDPWQTLSRVRSAINQFEKIK
jgi:hypothetical protein